jgi:hypothetical protein
MQALRLLTAAREEPRSSPIMMTRTTLAASYYAPLHKR